MSNARPVPKDDSRGSENKSCFGVSLSQLFFNFFALAKATSVATITQQELDVVRQNRVNSR